MKKNRQDKPAVGYVRTATVVQIEEGNSLEHQEQKIKEYCRSKGYALTGIISDSGKSGASLKRPGFKKLLSSVKRDGAKTIICTHPDRISRSVADYVCVRGLLKKHGVELIFTDYDITDNPYVQCIDEFLTAINALHPRISKRKCHCDCTCDCDCRNG